MKRKNPESRREELKAALIDHAVKLVVTGNFTAEGAINAAMDTYSDSVSGQRKKLFGPIIKEVRRSIAKIKKEDEDMKAYEETSLKQGAWGNEQQQLRGFDGEDEPCEPNS